MLWPARRSLVPQAWAQLNWSETMPPPVIRAIAFDAFGTLFDVYSVSALGEQLFPGRGSELANLWRAKQIEYTFLRTMSDRYKPFDALTEDALCFSADRLGLALDDAARDALMDQYGRLSPFPENIAALHALRGLGLPLAILSNGTPQMLQACVENAAMNGIFDHVLSVDAVRRYKTSAQAYGLGPAAFACPAGEILFVSSNGWDVAGATWYGYLTFWINRSGQPTERLDVAPHRSGTLLTEVVDFVRSAAEAG
jgi:2-haloacid dehalogenase